MLKGRSKQIFRQTLQKRSLGSEFLPHRALLLCRASCRTLSCLVYFISLRLARVLVDSAGQVIRQTRAAAVAAKQHDEHQGDEGEYGDSDGSVARHQTSFFQRVFAG
jgi:hypothetical protein